MTTSDWIRLTFALISLAAFGYWVSNTYRWWNQWNWNYRRVSIAVAALLFAIAYGFLEAMNDGLPLYPRTFAVGAVLLGLLASLIADRRQ